VLGVKLGRHYAKLLPDVTKYRECNVVSRTAHNSDLFNVLTLFLEVVGSLVPRGRLVTNVNPSSTNNGTVIRIALPIHMCVCTACKQQTNHSTIIHLCVSSTCVLPDTDTWNLRLRIITPLAGGITST
jgi:hypothetical protein